MAQTDWAELFEPPQGTAAEASGLWRLPRWLLARLTAWEDWLTFLIAFFTFLGVAESVQAAEWVEDMPSLALVAFLGLLCGLLLARSPLPQVVSHPLALIAGATVVLWQVLALVPGDGWVARWGVFYDRLSHWLEVARSGGISNDTLPFILLVVALTWLFAYLFAWSVFRWHNPWLALLPGGAALFVNFTFSDQSSLLAVLYIGGGLLLIMRLSLTRKVQEWQRQGVSYPEFLSLSSAHLTSWAVLLLILMSWLTPAAVDARPLDEVWGYLSRPALSLSDDAIRLAGPIKAKKSLSIHDFSSVLPFRGSIKLSNRSVISVTLENGADLGDHPFLRGAVYDEYQAGGWKAAGRREATLTASDLQQPEEQFDWCLPTMARTPPGARIQALRAHIQVADAAVARSLVFSIGQPLGADIETKAQFASDSVYSIKPDEGPDSSWRPCQVYEAAGTLRVHLGAGSAALSDQEVFDLLPPGLVGLEVVRNGSTVERVDVALAQPAPDIALLKPAQKLRPGDTYTVMGAVADVSADELRAAREFYPGWAGKRYFQLPEELPQRVRELANELTAGIDNPYDKAKAIEEYLRLIPVDYQMRDIPPARDAVDYFLFEAQEGYFDYHASAMVVLLRAAGVPARLAVGYLLDRSAFDSRAQRYNIREAHAYAWPEVYFSGIGWMPFNPSPDRPAIVRPGELSGGAGWWGIDSFLREFPPSREGTAAVPSEGAPQTSAAAGQEGDYFFVLWLVVGLAVAAGAIVLGSRLAWERGLAGLPYCQRVWEETLRLATCARLGPRPDQTPREYAHHLETRLASLEGLDLLAEAYGRCRFGGKPLPEDEAAQLRPIWRRVRNRLLTRILVRR
jgi:transglutaminase-like putative cysteine protease